MFCFPVKKAVSNLSFQTTTLGPDPVIVVDIYYTLSVCIFFIISSYSRCCALCARLCEHPGTSPPPAAWESRDVGLDRRREKDEGRCDREMQTDKDRKVCVNQFARNKIPWSEKSFCFLCGQFC